MKSMNYPKRHNNEFEEKKIKRVKLDDHRRPIKNYKKVWEEHAEYEEIDDFFAERNSSSHR